MVGEGLSGRTSIIDKYLRIYMPPCAKGEMIFCFWRHILSKIGYLDIDFTEKAARAMSVYGGRASAAAVQCIGTCFHTLHG